MFSCRLYKTNVQFAPTFVMSVLTLLTCMVFIKLGLWQLHRGEEKKLLIQHYQQHGVEKPLSLDETLQQKSEDLQFRKLIVTGHYDQQHTFLLDNRFYNHQLGYYVVTPFYIKNQILLVNRGFLAKDNIATLMTPNDNQTIQGYIDFPVNMIRLSHQLNDPHAWPRIIESLDVQEISQILKQPIYPFVIKLLPSESHGFVREWSMVTTMTPERHQAYAFQWFVLAMAVFIVFIVTNSKKIV